MTMTRPTIFFALLSFACSSPPSGPVAVVPATGDVLTCSSLQLKETGGSGSGAWSVSPASGSGAVNASGLYAAPLVSPVNPAVTVTYAEGTSSASSQLTVATAFVGQPGKVPIGNEVLLNVPFDHQFTTNGSQIYAAVLNGDFLHVDLFASPDGATFTAAGSYHTGNVECATAAVDAGNSQVVYLAYLAGHGDSTSNTGATLRLAVSTDGAKSFPVEYVVADSINGIANLICPDVTSPSANNVVVLGAVENYGNVSPAHVGTWTSNNQGMNIGPVGMPLQCTTCPTDGSVFYAASDTNTGAAQTTYPISVNGGGYSPRASTSGKGDVCMVFQYAVANNPSRTEVQCSTNNGATWTAPLFISAPSADTNIRPTIAVSPAGKVAVAWVDTVVSAIQAFVAFSTDGGKTFGTPIQYPQLPVPNFGVVDPVVAWENDDVLWISQTADVGNAATLFIDKTCDMGVSWSGSVQVATLVGTSLLKTASTMVVAGYDSQTPASLSAFSLGTF
jgi:hypothetical protein